MSDVMQGYDMEAAVSQIGKADLQSCEGRARHGGGFRAARHRKRICATCTKRAC
ncbi:MAG: hypothetical protein ACLUHE_04750 [Christensenellales bacterium]